MKIRIKNKNTKDNLESHFVDEIDDEKSTKTEIDIKYLESVVKILKSASGKTFIRYDRAFEKFLTNLKRATKYSDKVDNIEVSGPSFIHVSQTAAELKEYREKALKYDKKAKALFTMHSGWYENLLFIIDEINSVYAENKNNLDNEVGMLYMANLIDGILAKYSKKSKQKTL